MPMPIIVYLNTVQFSPGGGLARGPWGPKAIQYAKGHINIKLGSPAHV